jgi:DNA-binding NtrC family response regulator
MVTMVKMRLLLVDDEERFLQTTKKLLAKKGYDALTAVSGAECLKTLEKELVHVVILDVKMPGMDGVETLRAIKQRFPLVEVIMLTGHATAESAVEGMKLGATDYLTKPTDIEDLITKAEEAFNKRIDLERKIQMAEALKKSQI